MEYLNDCLRHNMDYRLLKTIRFLHQHQGE